MWWRCFHWYRPDFILCILPLYTTFLWYTLHDTVSSLKWSYLFIWLQSTEILLTSQAVTACHCVEVRCTRRDPPGRHMSNGTCYGTDSHWEPQTSPLYVSLSERPYSVAMVTEWQHHWPHNPLGCSPLEAPGYHCTAWNDAPQELSSVPKTPESAMPATQRTRMCFVSRCIASSSDTGLVIAATSVHSHFHSIIMLSLDTILCSWLLHNGKVKASVLLGWQVVSHPRRTKT